MVVAPLVPAFSWVVKLELIIFFSLFLRTLSAAFSCLVLKDVRDPVVVINQVESRGLSANAAQSGIIEPFTSGVSRCHMITELASSDITSSLQSWDAPILQLSLHYGVSGRKGGHPGQTDDLRSFLD